MKNAVLLSTALSASLALNAQVTSAQSVLDEAPERPALIDPDTTVDGVGNADPDADVTIEAGTLSVASPNVSTFFPTFEVGLILEGAGSMATLAQGAQITAPTDGSFGVVSLASGNTFTIDGDVFSDGALGGGVLLTFGDDNTVNVGASGTVFTTGDSSPGIGAFGSGHTINVDGRVQTQGIESSGVLVGFGTGISVNVGATGQVLSEGDFAPALSTLLNPFESDIRFTNAGLVQSFGNVAPGIVLATPGATAVNDGTIATLGDGAPGVLLVQSNVGLINTGTIVTSGGTFDTNIELLVGLDVIIGGGGGTTPTTMSSAGVFIANGGVDVTNSGSILAANGPAIVTSAEFAAITNASGFGAGDVTLPILITNTDTGVIEGSTVAIQGSDLIEQVSNSGSIVGDVLLAGGDDSFSLALPTGTVDGVIDGGDGTDSLVLSGAGVFDGATQTGFETLNLTGGGEQSLSGDFGSFTSLLAESGAIISLTEDAAIALSSGATFDAGSVLTGSGTITGAVTSSGVVDPGGQGAIAPGTLTIDGDFALAETGTLVIGLNGADIDMLDITGAADIAGTLSITSAADTNLGLLPGDAVIVQTGGGITAGDLAVETFNSGVLTLVATPTITADAILLNLDVSSDFAGIAGLDANALAVAGGIDSGFAASPAGGVFRETVGLVSPAASAALLDSLSPEFYDVVVRASVLSADRAMDQAFNRLARTPLSGNNGLWASISYESFDRDGSDVFDYEIDQFSAVVGVDFTVGSLLVGVAGTYSNSDLEVASSALGDAGDLENVGLQVYGSTTNAEGFNMAASLGYQSADADTQRGISAVGFQNTLQADLDADVFFGEVRGSYLQPLGGNVLLNGWIGLDYYSVDDDSFAETGGGALALAVDTESYDEFGGTVAIELVGDFGTEQAPVRPFIGTFVRRVFSSEVPVFNANFVGTPASAFTVEGSLDRTEYGVNAGISAVILNGAALLSASYRGTFSDDNDTQGGAVSVVVRF